MSLLTYIGFTKYSQNLDGKVVFLINGLKKKNLEIEALKGNNVLSKIKVSGLMNSRWKCTSKLLLYSQLLKTSKDCKYYTGVTNMS